MKTTALKYLANVTLGKMLQSGPPKPGQEVLPYLKASSITTQGLDVSNLQKMPFSDAEQRTLTLRADDVVVVEGGSIGRSAYISEDLPGVHFQNSINRVRPRINVDGRFLRYAIEDLRNAGYFEAVTNLATIRHLTAEKLERSPITVHTHVMQSEIADFLDRETAEIDAFIKDAWELIRYTKEHQDAELDAIVREKGPSLVKLKYVAEITTGFPFKSDSFKLFDRGLSPLLRGINVSPGRLDWSETVAISPDKAKRHSSYVLQEGDLVLGMDRPFIGEGLRIAPVTFQDSGALLVQRVARIRANTHLTSPEWLYSALRGSLFKAHLEPTFTGVSVPHISPSQIGDFLVPLPARTEQESRLKILLQREIATRDILADTERAIEFAKERRAALISAAVTGQIDVTQKRRPVAEVLEDEVGVRV